MDSIRIENLTKRYGENAVLQDYSLNLPQGRIYALMGPSGKGKTTLLRLLAGLETPDEGTISGLPTPVSFLFQEDRLFETLTVRANLKLFCRNRAEEKEAKELVKRFGLLEAYHASVSKLSGGMKRRVALIRALLIPSRLLLLDEPFKGLDSDTRLAVISEMLPKFQGKTVIVVTHDRTEAMMLGAQMLEL